MKSDTLNRGIVIQVTCRFLIRNYWRRRGNVIFKVLHVDLEGANYQLMEGATWQGPVSGLWETKYPLVDKQQEDRGPQ